VIGYGSTLHRCHCGALMAAHAGRCTRCKHKAEHAAGIFEHIEQQLSMLPDPEPKPVIKHLPTRYLVQHDPVAAHYRWAQAVSR